MAEAQAARLEEILIKVVSALRELPVERRTALERQRAAGWIYPMHELVVDRIGKGLLFWPESFPDIRDARGKGALLLERQARAGAWLALRAQLLSFADICLDGAQREQGLAVQEAGEVADLVLSGLRQREMWPGLDHGARLAAVLMGLLWRQESMKEKGRGRAAKREGKEIEEPTPRQKQAAEARKQERREALRALFQAWMTKR